MVGKGFVSSQWSPASRRKPDSSTDCHRRTSRGVHPASSHRWWGPFTPFAPAADRLITDDDTALEQQLFNITQAELEPEVPPYRVADDRRREPMAVIKRSCLLHRAILRDRIANVTEPSERQWRRPQAAAADACPIDHGCGLLRRDQKQPQRGMRST